MSKNFSFSVKDVKLGFWVGAGLFLFSAIIGVIQWLIGRARGQVSGGSVPSGN